jgi:hypothetical protein
MLAARQSRWKAFRSSCDANRESMELAGVASASPRKFIAWMAGHPFGPRIFQAASRPTSAEPSLPAPKLDLASVGRRGQRRGIQRGLGRCSCIMLQIRPCWPLIAHVQVWLFGSTRIGWCSTLVDAEVSLPAILVVLCSCSLSSVQCQCAYSACRVLRMYTI